MTILKTNLWFFAGSSDKVYVATLTLINGVYTLTAQWGRRGKTLQSQIKGNYTSDWEARREFHNLVASKTVKGYQVTEKVGA
jgi:predicted DNA-binding WGR domain protein